MGDFGDTSKAFLVPDAEISWMLSHYYDCHAEAVWFQFTNPSDNWNKMYFGAGVIIAERFSEARIHAMLVGPGLPTPVNEVPVEIPDQVLNDPNMSENVLFLGGAQDQSTCSHLAEPMLEDDLIIDGRCVWYERFTKTNWWWVLDHDEIEIPIGGETYYIVAWEENNRQVKAVFGVGYWAEDFWTQYPEIEENRARSQCPSIEWFDDFNEKSENPERDANLPGDICEEGDPSPNAVVYPNHSHDNTNACVDDDEGAVAAALSFIPGVTGCADLAAVCSLSYMSTVCPVTCGACETVEEDPTLLADDNTNNDGTTAAADDETTAAPTEDQNNNSAAGALSLIFAALVALVY